MFSTADPYPFPAHGAPARYTVAFGSVAIVLALSATFGSIIDEGSHFLLLGTAVMVTAWFAGTGPALAATVAGALVGAWEGQPQERATHTHLALFVVHGLVLTALVSELRRARRLAEQQVRDAQQARRESELAGRMKDEFLATISHELRTPLNSVLGWIHLLRTGNLDGPSTTRGLESIERNVRLQAQLTGDLLDISKVLTGQIRLETRPVSLTDSARQAVTAAIPVAQTKGVGVTSSIPESALPVLGDPTRLRQIVWHLLVNAIKFTPKGGSVRITVTRDADSALLTIADSGPGIDPAFLPRIFDRFTQEDPSPTRTVGGLGIGLSLVRDLVELHGAEITAANRTGQESGAVFTARFPLHDVNPESRGVDVEDSAIDATSPPDLDGLRVLVLDRDADGRELLRVLLQRRGALVQTADSVASALEALEAWRPDVLVSDNSTPEHDTYAVVGKVPSLEADRGGRIPAAALTAFSRTDGSVRRMLDASHRDIPKPVEPAVLTAEVARLAGRVRHRMRRTS